MKAYSIFTKNSEVEPHLKMQFSIIPKTLVGRERSYSSAERQLMYYSPSQQARLTESVVLGLMNTEMRNKQSPSATDSVSMLS